MFDDRKVYMSPEERVIQAKRLLPVIQDEIDGGESRQLFFDILEMCKRDLRDFDECYLNCYFEGKHPKCEIHRNEEL